MSDLHPDFNPMTSESFRKDPYPILAQVRESHPVAHFKTDLSESWSVMRYDDVKRVLLDAETFSSDRSLSGQGDKGEANLGFLFNNMISASGEKHRRLKLIGNKVFMPKYIENFRPQLESVVEERMEMALSGETFDLVEDFSAQITVAMICAILGIPREEMDQIRKWTAVLGDNSGAVTWLSELDPDLVERGRSTGLEMTDYFQRYLAERRRAPRQNDLISAFIEAEVDGERLNDAEILSTAMLLLLAGNETTTNLMTNFVRLMDKFPAPAATLRNNPDLTNAAIEETLRLRNSIRNVDRFATRDVTIAGVKIPKDGQIVVWLTSANRDPLAFDHPDEFILDRKGPNKHVAFGYGAHLCLGAPLARMESRLAARAILERTKAITLIGEPVFGCNGNFDNILGLQAQFHSR